MSSRARCGDAFPPAGDASAAAKRIGDKVGELTSRPAQAIEGKTSPAADGLLRLMSCAATAHGFASPVTTQRVLLQRERTPDGEGTAATAVGDSRPGSTDLPPIASGASLVRAARQADVTQDHTSERQIHRDRARTGDEDLLSGDVAEHPGDDGPTRPTSTN